MTETRLTYEDKSDVIDEIIEKHRYIWQLRAVRWMDYDDVAQTIRAHIARKWDMWDQTKPIEPWAATVTRHQIRNVLRNHYLNYVRPCTSCPHSAPGEVPGCMITQSGTQNSECPRYAKWEKTKKAAYNVKLSVSLETGSENQPEHIRADAPNSVYNLDYQKVAGRLHDKMKQKLGVKQFKVYEMLYIKGLDEEIVAKEMGYKTTECGKKAGYKQIKNLKKMFRQMAMATLETEDIIPHHGE